MRHRRKGRKLGRSPSHQRALLRGLAINLFLTERDADHPTFAELDPETEKPVRNRPAVPGRIVTTLAKAKEARPFVERCVTIAKEALGARDRANGLNSGAARNSDAWRAWRKSPRWAEWNAAMAPVVTARRRLLTLLGHNNRKSKSEALGLRGAPEAVTILMDVIAPRFVDRRGGYTRILKLSRPRLGDAGPRAILEFVGKHDRAAQAAPAPAVEEPAAT